MLSGYRPHRGRSLQFADMIRKSLDQKRKWYYEIGHLEY